ncbi:hypothetical protein C6497_07800 [Candidatus Poribacteria bacterium]|nr:MAG: hypothetical protein C6497_07800 [Candidatus Poribacteria bacterium]
MKSITPIQADRLKAKHFILPIIIFISLLIRLPGIGVGLPYTPDPREVLIAEDVLNLINFESPPTIYNWPGTAWFYLIAIVGKTLSVFNVALTNSSVILIGRYLNVLFGMGTVWFTFKLGNSLYNRQVGTISAAFLAVTMLHATNESRFAIVDIPATFCITLFFYLLSRESNLRISTCLKLGLVAGVGIAIKYPTIFVLFSILIYIKEEHFYRKLLLILSVCSLVFTVICPYWIIDSFSTEWNYFFNDFWYEAQHYNKGHFGLFTSSETGIIYRYLYLGTLLKWGMGFPLAILVVCGLLWEFGKLVLSSPRIRNFVSKKYKEKMKKDFNPANITRLGFGLLIFIITYFLFIGSYKVTFTRHLIILYPLLMIFASVFLCSFHRGFVLISGCIVWVISLVYTCAFASIMWTQPTGQEASEWISENIPVDIGIRRPPEVLCDWLYPELDRELTQEISEWILITQTDNDIFLKYYENPQDFKPIDWFPLDDVNIEETLDFYELIWNEDNRYELIKTFQRQPSFLGIGFSDSTAPFPINSLLHPEIHLYKKIE